MQSLAAFFHAVSCAFYVEFEKYYQFKAKYYGFATLSAGTDWAKKAILSLVERVFSFARFVVYDCLRLQAKGIFHCRAVCKNHIILAAYAALRGYSVNNVSELYSAMEAAIDNGYTELFKLLQRNFVNFGGHEGFEKDRTIALLNRAQKKNVDIARLCFPLVSILRRYFLCRGEVY